MSHHRKLWNFLGSRNLSVFIFVMGMVYFLILLIFSTVVPLPWVEKISRLLPYRFLYVIFFINLIICEIKWVPVIIKRCKRPMPSPIADSCDNFRVRVNQTGGGGIDRRLHELRDLLLRRRFTVREEENDRERSTLFHAYKGRYSPVGNLLFHFAFFLLAIGVSVSTATRFEGNMLLAPGQSTTGSREEYLNYYAARQGRPPEIYLELERVVPEFWEGKLFFTALDAYLRSGDNSGVATMSSPFRIKGADITIQGASISPEYTLKDRYDKVVDQGVVNLNIFIPGKRDEFSVPSFPYIFDVSFLPDAEEIRGRVINRSMEMKNPLFHLSVVREGGRNSEIFSGYIKPGEDAEFEGLRISLSDVKYGGMFRVVHDGGVIFIWIAFVLMISGLIWKLLFYRKEITAFSAEGGEIYVVGRSEYYSSLFRNEVRIYAKLLS